MARVLQLLVSLTVTALSASGLESRRSQCERISIPMCQDMPYNLTRMPNMMGHIDQAEAAIQVHEFLPLVEIGCSKHLKFFLCSLYAPMCTEQVDIPIPSCQSICEEVKTHCLPVLRQFDFNWPHTLNCSRLPIPEKNGLCMEFPNITDERQRVHKPESARPNMAHKEMNINLPSSVYGSSRYPSLSGKTMTNPNRGINIGEVGGRGDGGVLRGDGGRETSRNLPSWGRSTTICPNNFFLVLGKTPSQDRCAPRCGQDVFFTREDKNFAEIWMGVWSAVCFMSTLFTVSTFCIDTSRFRYPEKPIIFMSMCFCLSSVAYLLRIFAGSELVSCGKTEKGEPHLVVEGLDSTGCIVVFLLLYYFGMASALWWVVLTITWYLAAGKNWGHEAIETRASYFHLVAWATPAVLTIVLLTLRRVDADELTGLCYVGNQDQDALLGYVIIPLCIFFFSGVIFIILGFISLVHVRKVMKHEGRNIAKLEKLMVRIGVFSVLYMVPAVCVIVCHWYEYTNRPKWKAVAIVTALECQLRSVDNSCRLKDSIPSDEVFLTKIFASLLLGITTGVWVWSSKTWNSWGRFCNNRLGRKPQQRTQKNTVPVYHPTIVTATGKVYSHHKAINHVTRV